MLVVTGFSFVLCVLQMTIKNGRGGCGLICISFGLRRRRSKALNPQTSLLPGLAPGSFTQHSLWGSHLTKTIFQLVLQSSKHKYSREVWKVLGFHKKRELNEKQKYDLRAVPINADSHFSAGSPHPPRTHFTFGVSLCKSDYMQLPFLKKTI